VIHRFQVSANASEPEKVKVGKCDVCHDWRVYELPLHIAVGTGNEKATSRLSSWGIYEIH
jgi:hypothetical protein